MPTIQVQEAPRPASRASSIKASASTSSFQTQFHQKTGDESTILHSTDPSEQPHYQITPEASGIIPEDPEVEALTSKAQGLGFEPDQLPEKPVQPSRLTPVKFTSAHVNSVLGPMGHLVKVDAKNPRDGQTATLEFHSLKSLMSKVPGFKELQIFPGPLVPGRTHKNEVIQFCQNKIHQLQKSRDNFADKDSQILMWDLMILLLRQKNTIDGSDIAELLLKNRDVHRPYDNVNNNNYGKVSPNEDAKLIGDEHKEDMKDSDNDDNASYVSEVDQETDEDFVKVINYLIKITGWGISRHSVWKLTLLC